MNTEEFVRGVYQTKEELLENYFESNIETAVGVLVKSLQLGPERMKILKSIVDGALTHAYYTMLIGIEGGGPIGSNLLQELKLFDEKNNSLTEGIGGLAFEYFQESN